MTQSTPSISEHQGNENKHLTLSSSSSDKSTSHYLKHVRQAVQARNKKTQVYTWTVAALQRQYQRRLCEDRLLAEKHEKEWQQLKQQDHLLEQDIANYTHQMQDHETQLQAARTYAQQRQAKYLTRQRQYHRFANIPLVRSTFQTKYLRAQKKNQQAESTVAAQRHDIDHLKDKRTTLIRQLQQQQQEQDHLGGVISDIRARMQRYEELMTHWSNGVAYWTEPMAEIAHTVDQQAAALLQQVSRPRDLVFQLETFRLLCLEYEETEGEGERQYNLDNTDFDCAKCMQFVRQDHPLPDKNRTTDILCTPCYQGARTSMIIKKKLGFMHSPSSSSSSLSSPSMYSSRQSSFINAPSPIPPPKDTPHPLIT
ncbi:hypothetical protein BC941DRAFT_431818 [Chlamydoabsidia padenii]|nr:hypothetical protein BC941DRAFT_431818 [Chlamydoabsidia padenii]